MNGPDGRRFPWGKIIEIHRLGDFWIVEHNAYISDNDERRDFSIPKQCEALPTFHPFVNVSALGESIRDVARSYPTLDAALIGALAFKYEGPNNNADVYACKMLGIRAYL